MVQRDVVTAPLRPSIPIHQLSMGVAGPILLAGGWILMSHVPLGPLWTAALRVLPAGLMLIAAAPGRPRGRLWWTRTAILGLVNVAGFFAAQAMSIQLAPMGIAATVTATQVLVVPIAARVIAATRIRGRQLCIAAVGVVGVGLLVLRPAGATDGVVDHALSGVDLGLLGVGVAAGAAMCSAFGLVLTGHWGVPEGTSAVCMTGWQLVVGGVVLVPLAFLVENGVPAVSGSSAAVLAALAVTTALAFGSMFTALHAGLPAVLVSRLMLMIPLLVTVTGWAFYGQSLTLLQGIGLMVVLGSITALTLSVAESPWPEPRPEPRPARSARR